LPNPGLCQIGLKDARVVLLQSFLERLESLDRDVRLNAPNTGAGDASSAYRDPGERREGGRRGLGNTGTGALHCRYWCDRSVFGPLALYLKGRLTKARDGCDEFVA
jgi:hypothetical protein